MLFLISLWVDGCETEEELEDACREFMDESLNMTASSFRVIASENDSNIDLSNIHSIKDKK